jgi:hypothetical protein
MVGRRFASCSYDSRRRNRCVGFGHLGTAVDDDRARLSLHSEFLHIVMARRRRWRRRGSRNTRRAPRFSPVEYWEGRPLCITCGERRTRNGTVCHKCKADGNAPMTYADSPLLEQWVLGDRDCGRVYADWLEEHGEPLADGVRWLAEHEILPVETGETWSWPDGDSSLSALPPNVRARVIRHTPSGTFRSLEEAVTEAAVAVLTIRTQEVESVPLGYREADAIGESPTITNCQTEADEPAIPVTRPDGSAVPQGTPRTEANEPAPPGARPDASAVSQGTPHTGADEPATPVELLFGAVVFALVVFWLISMLTS